MVPDRLGGAAHRAARRAPPSAVAVGKRSATTRKLRRLEAVAEVGRQALAAPSGSSPSTTATLIRPSRSRLATSVFGVSRSRSDDAPLLLEVLDRRLARSPAGSPGTSPGWRPCRAAPARWPSRAAAGRRSRAPRRSPRAARTSSRAPRAAVVAVEHEHLAAGRRRASAAASRDGLGRHARSPRRCFAGQRGRDPASRSGPPAGSWPARRRPRRRCACSDQRLARRARTAGTPPRTARCGCRRARCRPACAPLRIARLAIRSTTKCSSSRFELDHQDAPAPRRRPGSVAVDDDARARTAPG